jgi:hypothetical protein
MAPPTPVPSVNMTASRHPRAAPHHTSPSKAACASFTTGTPSARPSQPDHSHPSNPSIRPGMLSTLRSSAAANPGELTPTAATRPHSSSSPFSNSRTLTFHTATPPSRSPSPVGTCRSANRSPPPPKTAALMMVPPRSIPAKQSLTPHCKHPSTPQVNHFPNRRLPRVG